ncbi:MAG: circularly permuted type 2 ATP-grasp protein [Leptothrix ochracea]|uniref:circularly permuted type 2 ATP-grasp protein n=1 Tax=Leptothrix ochracea TaxID=735331 RepID=UPI0034E2A1DC
MHARPITSPTSSPAADPLVNACAGPLWQRFLSVLGPTGWSDLAARHARVQRRVREDGATYNVYAQEGDQARVWPLELLPFLIGAEEWRQMERGVAQRARLLNATLADVYGPQKLLSEGLLPASLICAHPQYLRPLAGIQPHQDQWLHVVAVDLARGPDEKWRVVGQRSQAPSGLGYLLENRLIVAQQFIEAFRELKVQRIASAFQALMEGLMRSSPAGERSRIALLTPGPRNETYFEHIFLARYLGLTLVEGSDLTVRKQKLYLKTLHGLERVHVLLRRVDDEWLDPLELRADSALGVPGLIQALRAGEVVVANMPGAGVLESPGLTAFWPAVSRRLLGEELLLPATTSWWCGEAAVWRQHRERLAEFVVLPTFPATEVTGRFEPRIAALLSPLELKALQEAIDANSAAYTLQAPARLSRHPVWSEGQIESRPAVVRCYAVADGQGGWRVLPGGLTRVGTGQGGSADAFLSIQRGSASTDTWALTDGPVDPTSLLPKPLAPEDLVGWHRPITSRAAENLFWIGRYTERAENTLRLARLLFDALAGASAPVLAVLHALAVRNSMVSATVPGPLDAKGQVSVATSRAFEHALLQAMLQAPGAGPVASVGYNLKALRGCAEALRERLSPEHWTLIHEIADRFDTDLRTVMGSEEGEPVSEVLGVLDQVGTYLAAITGAQTDRMTRDDGWRLLSVGRQIERLDMLADALATGFEHGLHRIEDGFALLLGLFDSTITYRAQFQARREVPPLLHLLVLDTDNPRSLAWVARTLRDRLRKLARHDSDWAESVTATLPQPEAWSLAVLATPDELGQYSALIAALRTCSQSAQRLSSEVSRRLFSHAAAEEKAVWQ